jgi:DNA-binding transcriptional LysR family regulator
MSYDINLKHLEYFIKVARLGSINKAAQMLYVSQSHLGKIIHDLEETVGAPLLNRSRQGVTLTPEGNEFLERSVRILKEMEEMHLRPLKEMEKTDPGGVHDKVLPCNGEFYHYRETLPGSAGIHPPPV